ncbi:transportin-2-like protein [Anaeromyces robustus]|uniref:Transportin-2-like protein n=1 Tax=Anaeromyces robustus TaxID=1754192 RepID=A0A1Y1X081_9FUNG|nr:transportin-2-like protein [Anaeromyces robustus]|eukprot:ORX78846.1 transportin-2-like protein [Anaeromyces robustus]
MDWQPEPVSLQQLVDLLQQSTTPNTEIHMRVTQQLRSFDNIPDYNKYLAFIFTHLQQENISTRVAAGLVLKNNIKMNYGIIPLEVIEYVKPCAIQALNDNIVDIRSTAGTIITTICSTYGFESWPELLKQLVSLLDNQNILIVESSINALQKICEDSASVLRYDNENDLYYIIPKFIELFNSPSVKVRRDAIDCANQFILMKADFLTCHMKNFLNGLYQCTSDPSPEIKKVVCQAFVMILEVYPNELMEELPNVVKYMLYCTQDEDESVALEACEFWLTFAEQPMMLMNLSSFIPDIVPVLLKGMIYSPNDIAIIKGLDEDDTNIPDNEQDIKPRHHKSKQHYHPEQPHEFNEDYEESDDDFDDDDDDDEKYSEWNLRKCSAAALDVMASTIGDKLLEVLLPLLNTELQSTEWEHVESAILALGAVGEGCQEGMKVHLPTLWQFLLSNLDNPKPLVRSITCWTLGRYAKWSLDPSIGTDVELHRRTYFNPLLEKLLDRILDNNKRVQEAGCSAFATLEEIAQGELIPYLKPILEKFAIAFTKYQNKNLLILYDAVGTLADSVGEALNQPELIEILMPPLNDRWNQISDDDNGIFPLLECLSSVAIALGPGFIPFAQPIWQRCINIIERTFILDDAYKRGETEEKPDKDFIIVALDLLSGIFQGLGNQIEFLMSSSYQSLLDIILKSVRDDALDVQQSAYALLGDVAISAYEYLKPRLPEFMIDIVKVITTYNENYHDLVCNNAIWATGEISLKAMDDMKQYIGSIIEPLIMKLNQESKSLSLLENIAITISRIGFVCPEIVSLHLPMFFKQWCSILRDIADNKEKESAFFGMCKMIEANPNAIIEDFVYFCDAIVHWTHLSPQLNMCFINILNGFKQMIGENWEQCLAKYPDEEMRHIIRQRLQVRYQV